MARLTKNPFLEADIEAEDFVSEGALQVYRYLDTLADREDESNVLRASVAPLCVRRRWLQARGLKGKRLAPRALSNFILGELFEYAIKHLIKTSCVGPARLYSEVNFGKVIGTFTIQKREFEIHEQLESRTKIGPLTIVGHWDGVGRRNFDGKWEMIEAKSASDYGFRKFKAEGPGEYIKQAHVLMMSDVAKKLGITETRYFYGRKQKGHLHDVLVPFQESVADMVSRDYLASVGPECPAPPHSLTREISGGFPTGRLVALTFPCTYCPYLNTEHCHNGLTRYVRRDQGGNRKPFYAKKAVFK